MPKEYPDELERSKKLLDQSTTRPKEVSERYQELILFLSIPDERVRENAIESLGEVRENIVDRITPLDLIQILDLLEDTDGIVRAKTAATLRQLIREDINAVSQITDQEGLPRIYHELSDLIENEQSIVSRFTIEVPDGSDFPDTSLSDYNSEPILVKFTSADRYSLGSQSFDLGISSNTSTTKPTKRVTPTTSSCKQSVGES